MASVTMDCICGAMEVFKGQDLERIRRGATAFTKRHAGEGHSFQPSPLASRRSKFGNKSVEIDGHKFDSLREGKRYCDLRILERAGEITDLKLQVPFECRADGELIETYIADFTYYDRAGNYIVEDAKGCITPTYRRKRRWMKRLHHITIKET